ncbi:hypothetical protein BH09VER1_BH09VER1_17970 [soil metagenome]
MRTRSDSPKAPEMVAPKESRRVSSRLSNRFVRAAGCAAFEIFTDCKKYNSGRPGNYLSCVFHVMYGIIRAGAPRQVPVPPTLNRSVISDAERKFADKWEEKIEKLELQAKFKRRPSQPKMVTDAMSMIPSAKSGKGPQRAKKLFANLPPWLRPIHWLMSEGAELLMLHDRFANQKKRDEFKNITPKS